MQEIHFSKLWKSDSYICAALWIWDEVLFTNHSAYVYLSKDLGLNLSR